MLAELFGRIRETVDQVLEGLGPEQLDWRPASEANSLAWIVWHLTRVQDDHLAELAGAEQVWRSEGWAERFRLPYEVSATGYGQSPEEVGLLTGIGPDLLGGYHRDTCERTLAYLRGLSAAELDRVVDRSYDPPVTLGVRLSSVVTDDLEHAGQAAYLRGLLPGRP